MFVDDIHLIRLNIYVNMLSGSTHSHGLYKYYMAKKENAKIEISSHYILIRKYKTLYMH